LVNAFYNGQPSLIATATAISKISTNCHSTTTKKSRKYLVYNFGLQMHVADGFHLFSFLLQGYARITYILRR